MTTSWSKSNARVREAAEKCFGGCGDQPNKKWITDGTWQLVRLIAPLRRRRAALLKITWGNFTRAAFSAWKSAIRSSDWLRYGVAMDDFNAYAYCFKADSKVAAWILGLQRKIRPLITRDREAFLDELIIKADRAMENADFRTSYAVIRALGGGSSKQNTSLLKLDGELTSNQSEVEERWTEHFASVYNGSVTERGTLREPPRPPSLIPCTFDVGPEATQLSFARLGRNKGTGLDDIPAELLVAGGAPAAIMYSGVNNRVAANTSWPTQWKGGQKLPRVQEERRSGMQLVPWHTLG